MIIIGVDPGINGAVAFLNSAHEGIVSVCDIPTSHRVFGRGRQVSPVLLCRLIDEHYIIKRRGARAVIEAVSSSPQQGVRSAFNFGHTFGVIEGVLSAMEIPLEMVRPQSWKRHFGLLRKDKDASRTKALQLYPEMGDRFARKKDADRAEALLMARYLMETDLDRALRRPDTAGGKPARRAASKR